MAENRYGERGGWRDEDRERGRYGARDYGRSRDRDEEDRGFFERAGDEIRSWFGGEDDDRRGRDEDRGWSGSSGYGGRGAMYGGSEGGGLRGSERSDEYGRFGGGERWSQTQTTGTTGYASQAPRGGWGRDEDYRASFSDRDRERSYGRIGGAGEFGSSSDRDFGRSRGQSQGSGERSGYGREHGRGGFQGDYGGGRQQGGFGGQGDWSGGRESMSPQSRGGREDETGGIGYSEFRGTLGGFGNQRFGSSQDDHYLSWRNKQIEQLDRDYEEYCRDCEQRFQQDFDSWRRNRQGQLGSQGETATSSLSGTTSGGTSSGQTGGGPSGGASGSSGLTGAGGTPGTTGTTGSRGRTGGRSSATATGAGGTQTTSATGSTGSTGETEASGTDTSGGRSGSRPRG